MLFFSLLTSKTKSEGPHKDVGKKRSGNVTTVNSEDPYFDWNATNTDAPGAYENISSLQ